MTIFQNSTSTHSWYEKWITPGNTFLIVGFIFGLAWTFITPPFQAPDENLHFCRSFELSEGGLIAQRFGEAVGDSLPKSLVESMENINPGVKFHSKEGRQDLEILQKYLRLPLNKDDKVFYSFPSSAIYAPAAYLPQLLGIWLGKILDLPPLLLMYLGRLANLSFWIVVISLAIKLLPVGRWLFMVIALMPMNLFLAASLNQDAVINSLSMLLIAYLLRLSTQECAVQRRDLVLVGMLAILLALSKPVNALFSFLFLMVPKNRFGSSRDYLSYFAVLVFSTFAAVVLWSAIAKDVFVSLMPWSSYKGQMAVVLSNPLDYLMVNIRTFWTYKGLYLKSHVGQLGWLDTVLPGWVILGYYLLLGGISLYENGLKIPTSVKYLFAVIFVGGILGISLSLHLICSPVGAPYIHGIQGRYFIPFAPLFWLLLNNGYIRTKLDSIKIANFAVLLFLLIALSQVTFVMIERYYL